MKYNKQIYLGIDPDTGKQIRKWIHAETSDELKKKIRQAKNEFDLTPNTSEISFKKYADQWLKISKGTKSKQTQDAARTHLRKCSSLDRIPIRKITRSQCQEIVNASWEHPHAAKGVSDVLRQVFQAAQRDGIIAINPAIGLDRPKIRRPERHLLTDQEVKAIKKAKLNDQDRMFVTILLMFGLRPAEALALSPADFDLDARILHITKALEMTNDNASRIKSTKTGEVRDIPLPDKIIPKLRKYFRSQKSMLLFTKSDGQQYTKSAYKRMQERVWSKVDEALGAKDGISLVKGRSFYDCRHYKATELYYLCQKGKISTKYAAEYLGHSEIMFLSIYSHLDENKESKNDLYPDIRKII